MPRPTLSVLVPTFNRANFLPHALNSILGQTVPPEQVIVVNDGSTDETEDVLQRYAQRIQYIRKENEGKASAVNLGLEHVTGECIWIVDDDDVVVPDAWERHSDVLQRRPDAGFTFGPHYTCKLGEDGRPIEPVQLHAPPDLPDGDLFLRLMEWTFFGGASTFVRARCFRELGGFDPALIRSQDVDFIVRLWRRFRGARVDHPIFYARIHSGLRGPAKSRWAPEKSNLIWREYNRMAFTKLRKELSLSDYLPRSSDWRAPEPIDRRRAHLQRMTIMIAKGMYGEALEDLRSALEDPSDNRALSQPERELLRRAMSYPWHGDVIFEQADCACRIRGLCAGAVGREIGRELARVLYERAVHARRSKDDRFARLAFMAAFRILGVRNALQASPRVIAIHLRNWRSQAGSKKFRKQKRNGTIPQVG